MNYGIPDIATLLLLVSFIVNVNRIRDQGGFDEMKKKERMADREAVKGMHHGAEGGAKEQIQHSKAPPPVTEKFPVSRHEFSEQHKCSLDPWKSRTFLESARSQTTNKYLTSANVEAF